MISCDNPLGDAESWDRSLRAYPQATVFHSAGWARLLTESYGHEPCYLTGSAAGGVRTLLPLMEVSSPLTGRRGVSVPFADQCTPLCEEAEMGRFLDRAVELGLERRWNHVELRGVPAVLTGPLERPTYLGHAIALEGSEEDLFGRMASSMRRGVRHAVRAGVQVELGTGLESVRDYYRLHGLTRQRHGAPPQPWRFFENLHRCLIGPGQGFVLTARHAGTPVAAAVYLQFGSRAIFKYGGSDMRFQGLRANNLVMWSGMQECLRRGISSLDLGRTGCDNAGLRRFKLSLGAVETPISYVRVDLRNGTSKRSMREPVGRSSPVFRSVPRGLARLVGAWLYPHMD